MAKSGKVNPLFIKIIVIKSSHSSINGFGSFLGKIESETSARSLCGNDWKKTLILVEARAKKFAWLPSINIQLKKWLMPDDNFASNAKRFIHCLIPA